MAYREPDFQAEIAITALIHRANTNLTAELTAVATALGSDVTTHDCTIEAPPAALAIGPQQTRLTNDINVVVNKGKGGNLPNATMAAAIDGVIGVASKPGVVDVPYVSRAGSVASCTQGNWVGTPSSYAYQWKRDATTNIGTNSPTYTMVGADTGHQIGCVVTATNVTGSTTAPISNQIVGP